MKIGNGYITAVAAALGVGAVAAHHVSAGNMDPTSIGLATSETVRGVAFGAGGGAAAGLVTRASIVEILGRTFVGGLLAAVAAPWIAEHVMYVPISSTSYPVLCCSIGVIGYQIVHHVIANPSAIPGIGRVLGPLATGGEVASPPVAPAPPPVIGKWDTTVTPAQMPPPPPKVATRTIRVPLAR